MLDLIMNGKCEEFNDLNVGFDEKFTFQELGRIFIINTVKFLFIIFIKSKIDFSSLIWSPNCQNYLGLESMQRKSFKMFYKSYGFYPL